MNAVLLLNTLRARCVRISVREGRIRLEGRRSALDLRLRQAVAAEREALIAYLHWTGDPRPDLAEDSPAWSRLLPLAYERDGENPHGLFGILHGLRCWGALLEKTATGWRLAPRYRSCGGGWDSPGEWKADRARWLEPHRKAVTEMLRRL